MIKKLSFKGIILGALADIVGSNIWGIIAIVYLSLTYNIYVHPREQQAYLLQHLLTQDPVIVVLNLFVGGGFSVLGGYIAARIAKHDELLNGTLASFLCVFFAVLAVSRASIFDVMLSIVGNPLLALAGGYLYLQQKKRVKNKKKKKSK